MLALHVSPPSLLFVIVALCIELIGHARKLRCVSAFSKEVHMGNGLFRPVGGGVVEFSAGQCDIIVTLCQWRQRLKWPFSR